MDQFRIATILHTYVYRHYVCVSKLSIRVYLWGYGTLNLRGYSSPSIFNKVWFEHNLSSMYNQTNNIQTKGFKVNSVSYLHHQSPLSNFISTEQAGLSRATLQISSEFSSNFLLRIHKSQLIQRLLRYSIFNILMSSSILGRFHFEDFKNTVWSPKLQA